MRMPTLAGCGSPIMTSIAVQACHDRKKGLPMKVFVEDGRAGAHITNVIVRRIYDEVGISSPKKAEILGREACNKMMGSKGLAE